MESAFEDARFCATCHQFAEDDPALNGKLLENTFEEWRQSRYARERKPCQSCHMPGRRHLWRGIHDPDMVRSGLELRVEPVATERDGAALRLVLQSVGIGHFFPTYVTPRVVVAAWQKDQAGRILEESRQEVVIARDVSLDLTEERADTRIPPGGTATLDYRRPRHPRGMTLAWEVRVEPDHFYRLFYEAALRAGSFPRGGELIRAALRRAAESSYTLYAGEQPLARSPDQAPVTP